MIACIFSKNSGKFLEPATLSMPLQLFPLCNKPLICYIIDMLKKSGFKKAVVSVLNRERAIEDYFSKNPYNSFELIYGTEGINEDVLLINADTFYSMSLENAFKFHKNSKSDITVVTKSVSDCRNNRAVFTGNDKKILSFQDNPSYMDCVSLADTGIYLMSHKIFRMIENNDNISAEVLNRFISEKFSVYSCECIGYFCNINNVKNYIKCKNDILCKTTNADISGHRTLDGTITNGVYDIKKAVITNPICIGDNVTAKIGAVIDGMSAIGNNVVIGKNASIHNSVVMDNVYIGDNVICNNAVICKGAVLLNSASVYDNCIIGEEAVIGENTTVKNNSSIWNYKNTGSNKVINFSLRYGHSSELSFDENGISGESSVLTPHTALSVGMVLGKNGKNYVIGCSKNSAYSMALMSGLISCGGKVWNLGECLRCEVDFAIKELNADIGIYIDTGNIIKIIISDNNGLSLTSVQENELEYAVNHHIYNSALHNGFVSDASVYRKIYLEKLLKIMPKDLNFEVTVNTSDFEVSEVSKKLLKNVNMKKNNFNSLVFHISSDSRKISAYSEISGFVFHEKLVMICCKSLFERGFDITVPYGISNRLEMIADMYGRKVYRYSERKGSPKTLPPDFLNDAFILMTNVIKILSERNITLAQAVEELPQSAVSSKFVSIEKSPEKIIRRLCGKGSLSDDGTVIDSEKGHVSIKMSRSGKSMMIYAESSKYETAKELCDFVERIADDADN